MNKQQLAEQQLRAVADHLMLEFGSMLLASMAFLVVFITMALFAFRLYRCGFAGFIVVSVLTFMIPTPITLYLSPVMFVASIAAIVWLTIIPLPSHVSLPLKG